jgi:hypothetical protein
MMPTWMRAARLAALSIAATAAGAEAQSLSSRINNAPNGLVEFTFAAREGVCGNGRTYISVGSNMTYGSWNGSMNEREPCVNGPVRVVLNRIDGTVVDINTYVGPPNDTPGATDLGQVRARDAAEFLLSIAARTDGRPSRDAIMPAALADSAQVSSQLLSIARDRNRPRETRRTAISWLRREVDDRGGGVSPSEVVRSLGEIARDDQDTQQIRSTALSVLSQLERGDGVPPLIEISRSQEDPWLAKQAVQALARSGDPRARQFLRTAAQRSDLGDDIRMVVIRSIGGEYATSSDASFLRDLYPRLDGEKSRDAVFTTLSEMGGSENARWVLAIARDENAPIRFRRRAVQVADKVGITTSELVRLYDQVGDAQMKDALISVFAQMGTREATDKLLAIAKNETDFNMRKRAINQMSRSDDPRVKAALKEIVERQ